MSNLVTHLAINADDLPESMAFYRAVFGWEFEEYFPGFYRMRGGHRLDVIALQQRRDLLPAPSNGFECTVEVDDIAAVIATALANGGSVVADPATIPGVGELVWLADPAGNTVGAITYVAIEGDRRG
jgi:predicted enzyme related to lactoylglutathione lyase